MSEKKVLAVIGLISDTHFLERLFVLPENLARVWGPVDLILHAGDVGDLSVLHQGRHMRMAGDQHLRPDLPRLMDRFGLKLDQFGDSQTLGIAMCKENLDGRARHTGILHGPNFDRWFA